MIKNNLMASLIFWLVFPFISISQNTSSPLDFKEEIENCLAVKENDGVIHCLDSLLLGLKPDEFRKIGLVLFEKGKHFSQYNITEAVNYFEKAAESFLLDRDKASILEYTDASTQQAMYLTDVGEMQKAEKILIELEEYLSKEAPNNNEAWVVLSNINGLFNEVMGRYDKSVEWSRKSIDYLLKIDTIQSPDLATKYSNLGLAYQNQGDLENALKYLTKGREMLRKFKDVSHPSCLLDTYNIGVYHYRKKDYEEALKYFTEAVEALESQEKIDYVELNYFLNGRGSSYSNLNQYDKAYNDFFKTLEINQKTYAAPNIQAFHIKGNLASLKYKTEEFEEYEKLTLEAIREYHYLIKKNLALQTSDDLIDFFNRNNYAINNIYSASQTHTRPFHTLYKELYLNQLLQKGLGLEREILLNKHVKEKTQSKKHLDRWKLKKQELEEAFLNSDSKEITDKLERELVGIKKNLLINQMDQSLLEVNYAIEELQKMLPPKSVAIELVKSFCYDLSLDLEQKDREKENIYFALILYPDQQDIKLVKLFKENDLLGRLDSDQDRKENYVNRLYGFESRGATVSSNEKNLKELIVKPLLPHLEKTEKIFFAPDGLVHRINIGAIALDEFEVLTDKFDIYQLGSTRTLLNQESSNNKYGNSAILIGGLDFDMDVENSSLSRGVSNQVKWNTLKFTKREVDKIAALLKEKSSDIDLTLIKGAEGSEQNLRRLSSSFKSPRIIHLATHGFFLEQDQESDNQFKKIKNPMMRSGIVLSGGNKGWLGQSKDLKSDNILTASEIADMNLNHTELVVLSACETGLGDISNSEGVFGLQRAFKLAGVKYIIMSLWQVPDRETSAFMEQFYKNYLEAHLSIPDAFNKTQKEMRDRFFNPYQWAGFVLIE